MSKNLEVALSLVLRGQQAASAGLRKTQESLGALSGAARGASAEFKRLHDSVNGFSTVSKGLAYLGGFNLARQAEDTVLAYQRMQLELKQTAGLTNEQVAQISDYAKNSAAAMLSTPTAMLEGAMKLANAGMKWADLLPVLKQAASDAAAFRATVADMANMDFDISTKMKIDAGDLSAAHNMLLYHARSGRFEAPAMSRGAPELFTYASRVGLTGTQGLNLVGAMTQQVMKGVAPDQQTKVLTDFEQGFSHIVTPHYMKGLSKIGLDVEKYMPHGQFYGEGGVQGFLDLVRAMKTKGLTDPIKLAKAGFADKETKDFWLQMMNGVDTFEQSMREAATAAKSNQTRKDREEITASAVGQDQQAKAKWEARQLDAEKPVGIWEAAKNQFMENPLTSAASLAVLAGGARAVWKKRQAAKSAALEAADTARQASAALRPQNVFVMNWPKSLGGLGMNQGKPVLPEATSPTGEPTNGTKAGKSSSIGQKLVSGVNGAVNLAVAYNVGHEIGEAFYQSQVKGTDLEDKIGGTMAQIGAWFGNEEAQKALEINLRLEGQKYVPPALPQPLTVAPERAPLPLPRDTSVDVHKALSTYATKNAKPLPVAEPLPLPQPRNSSTDIHKALSTYATKNAKPIAVAAERVVSAPVIRDSSNDSTGQILEFLQRQQSQPIEINLHLDGNTITQVVNGRNARDSRRN